MTPLTDDKIIMMHHVPGVPVEFARELEHDFWVLLIGSVGLYEDSQFNFPVDTCQVFEKYKPMMDKLLGYSEPGKE